MRDESVMKIVNMNEIKKIGKDMEIKKIGKEINKEIKLVAADLDGTLLDGRGMLNPEFFDVYGELKARGIQFVAASGRQYYNLLKLFDSIRDEIVFIAENGTYVVRRSEELLIEDIPAEKAREVLREVREIEGAYPVLCGRKSAYIEEMRPDFVKQAQTYYERCVTVPDLMDISDDRFLKIAVYDFGGSSVHAYPLLRHFDDTLKVVVSGQNWLDVSVQEANKGNALELVMHSLGLKPEECMAFGDQMNDAEMLSAVGYGYAMANSSAELKRVAKLFAPSNNENGVLTVIRRELLGGK